MTAALRDLWDVRPGERLLTALMATNYFLLLVSYYLLKPARDSLFLIEVSPARLPIVFIVTALITAPLATAYARASQLTTLGRLNITTLGLLAASLALLRLLLLKHEVWTYYLLYAWVGVSGGLTTSQFWLLANAVWDASQAKRIFTVLGLGGILGAFVGGEVTNALVGRGWVATADLLWCSLLGLVASAVMTLVIWRRAAGRIGEPATGRPNRTPEVERLPRLLRSLFSSRHLVLTVAIIALAVATETFIDFQFKTLADAAYHDEAALTSFLGRFYGRMSLVALAVQVLLASRVIRWLGVGGAVLVLPTVLMGGTLLMLGGPLFVAAQFLRGGDLALKHSLDRTVRELLFLPVPLALVKRTKILADIFVDRWARGIAGLVLLGLTAGLGLRVHQLAVVVGVLVAAWLVCGVAMRRQYLESFRRALQRRQLDLGQLRVRLHDADSVELLLGALASGQPREALYALEMLQAVRDERLLPAIRPLVAHGDPVVRRHALLALERENDPELLATAQRLGADSDLGVRREALRLRAQLGDDDAAAAIAVELGSDEPHRQHAALAYLARYGGEDEAALLSEGFTTGILEATAPGAEEGRIALAGALGILPPRAQDPRWDRLLNDSDPAVVRAAAAGIGRQRNRHYVRRLLRMLADRRFRPDARAALVGFGSDILPELRKVLENRRYSNAMRYNILRVLRELPEQPVADTLLDFLDRTGEPLRPVAVRALSRLRSRRARLRFDPSRVERQIAREAEGYYRLARIGLILEKEAAAAASDAERLLERTLVETQRLHLQHVFRLLGLIYRPADIAGAYRGLVSQKRVLRANAQEFLDNLLRAEIKRFVLPLVDRQSGRALAETAEALFALGIRDRCGGLLALVTGEDTWLRCCGIVACRPEDPERIWSAIAGAARADDRLVAETARWRLAAAGRGKELNMSTVLEKVLLLQNVDLFAEVPANELAALALIAEEVEVLGGDVIYREDDTPDALYLVVDGRVRVEQGGRVITEVDRLVPFGTWALLDDEPRVTTATAVESTRLLRIDREDFADLMADQVQVAQGIIRSMAHRLRALVGRVA